MYHLHDSRFVYLCIVSIRVGPESSNSTDDGGNNGGRQQPRLDLLPHVGQVGAGVNLSWLRDDLYLREVLCSGITCSDASDSVSTGLETQVTRQS